MTRSKFTEEQIANALRQGESDTAPADVSASEKPRSTSENSSTRTSAVSELWRVRLLEEEHARLKRPVAERSSTSSTC